ncbi:MAG: hypothetical protein CL878_08930 [Dehalococcoidia bacterium]|nr:hypothetical protein [Dehalococcoidia bacterium]
MFIGPLMGGVTNVLLPVLRDDFTATLGQVTAVVSAYMVPFVLLQLVSGTIADRYSRGGTVTGGCAAFAASSALAAGAPNIEIFLAARVVQGAANAFVTPIIMATLGDVVPAPRLGRALGVFTTVNTAGLLLAPLLGGAFAETNWRLVYVLLTAVCSALAAYYAWWYRRLPASGQPDKGSESTGLAMLVRGLANRRLALLCAAGWLGYAGINGIPFIVALHLEAPLQLGAAQSGAVLAGFGLAGMLAAPWGGRAADRWGRRTVVATGTLGTALCTVLLGAAPGPWSFAVGYLVAGGAAAFMWSGLHTMAVEALPAQRGGASSVYNTFRFAGAACAPVLYTPLYAATGAAPVFWAAAGASLLILVPMSWHSPATAEQQAEI